MSKILIMASICRENIALSDFDVDWDYDEEFLPRWERLSYWHPREFMEQLSKV